MNDFRKFATSRLGINGMMLDDVMKAQAQYLNPYILEERQLLSLIHISEPTRPY